VGQEQASRLCRNYNALRMVTMPVLGKFKNLLWRFYADFLMPSRLGEYEALLKRLKSVGYVSLTATEYWQALNNDSLPPLGLLLRHDVDTSPVTARRQWEIEKHLGIKSTFYFRWLTFDPFMMSEIEASGSEIGYHYEELSDFAKQQHIRQAEVVMAQLETIKELFAYNLSRFRSITGLPVRTVASHGDFINRKLNLPNTVILENDLDLRERTSILFEAYDQEVMAKVTCRLTDYSPPVFWRPLSPEDALGDMPQLLYILIHCRHWLCRPYENLRTDWQRFFEGMIW